ncbi:MAG TPA: sensor histidine kinase [Burkholderiaceae bacterium]|jgi:two-component system sensor histidine kinase TctE
MISSIRGNLLKRLIVPLLIINLMGAGLTYWLAWIPTQIAFDQGLADAGWALISRLHAVGDQIQIDLSKQAEQILRVDHFDTIYFVVRDEERKTIAGDKDFPHLNHHPSQSNNPLAYDGTIRGEPVRIISFQTQAGDAPVFIGVAETLRKRNDSRAKIFGAFLLLEGLLTIISMVISWRAVTKGLLPLQKMQSDLGSRNHDDLSLIKDEQLPFELFPVVKAINGLLEKAQMEASAQQYFLANVAHQLRTPLAGLKAQLEWLKQKYTAENETVRSADLMLSSTERMIRQTNQLLALARAEPSRFEKARLEPVELNKLIEESVQYFVQEADKKHIDLGFDLHSAQMMGDHFLLRDLIDNLIDNAIRYSPPHGVVTVRCRRDSNACIFTVEDSGPGIPSSQSELVFNRYYRIDGTTEGNGLGLAIVRDIVKDHGAEIILKSGPGEKGTIFSVHFPV